MSRRHKTAKRYRPYDPAAVVELRGDLRGYLPEDHLVFLLDDLVDALDLRAITEVYEQGGAGSCPPPPPPRPNTVQSRVTPWDHSRFGTGVFRRRTPRCQPMCCYMPKLI